MLSVSLCIVSHRATEYEEFFLLRETSVTSVSLCELIISMISVSLCEKSFRGNVDFRSLYKYLFYDITKDR